MIPFSNCWEGRKDTLPSLMNDNAQLMIIGMVITFATLMFSFSVFDNASDPVGL